MNRYLKKSFAGFSLTLLSFAFTCVPYAYTRCEAANKPVTPSEFSHIPVQFLTDVHASIDIAGVKGGDYAARITRRVHFDLLQIKKVLLHFSIQEENLSDSSANQLDHEFRYLGIGYKKAKGRIEFFWDHTCFNPNRKLSSNKSNNIHWNELGIGYKTTDLMLGHKNDEIRFNSSAEWLHNIHWSAFFSRIMMKSENDYEWMVKLCLRDDILRITNQVFFCQLSLNSIYDDRDITFHPCIEIGDRIVFRSDKAFCLIPFVSYKHFHDWYGLGQGEDFLFAGLSLEMGLDQKRYFINQEKAKRVWAPKFHINGGYANFIHNKDYGRKSDVTIDLDVFKPNNHKILNLSTYVGILTLPHDLNPYIIRYKIGPSLTIELDNFGIHIFHSYSALYGIEYESAVRNYHLVGLKLNDKNASYWDWDLNIGLYPDSKGFDYWGDLQASLSYSFLKRKATPYINLSGHYLKGNDSLFGAAIEGGINIPGNTGSLSIYLCIQDNFDAFRFGEGSQNLFGFKFRF